MKRISFLLVTLALSTAPLGRAQDAATEERLNQLSGKIEDLVAGQEAQRKQLAELSKAIQELREHQNKPTPNYASQDELKRIADAVTEVDQKRQEDFEKIRKELLSLGKSLNAVPPEPIKRSSRVKQADNPVSDKPTTPEAGYEYIVKKGDALSVIAQAYRDKNIKVTVDDILKANPGLKEKGLQPKQKIFIPAPQQ